MAEEKEKGLPKAAIIGIIVVVVFAVVFIVMGQKQRFAPVVPGSEALDFTLPDLKGKEVSLKDYRGKVVFLNFWATWCEPCKREMPLLERTAAATPTMAFLEVDLDEDGETIRAFFDELGLVHLVPLLDVGLETSRRYGLASVPSTYFVDAGGTIRHMRIGEMDEAELGRGLDRIR